MITEKDQKRWDALTPDRKISFIDVYPQLAKLDKSPEVRMAYYDKYGYTEESLNDPDENIKEKAKQQFQLKEDIDDMKEFDRITHTYPGGSTKKQ
jgi:hypothetical protein